MSAIPATLRALEVPVEDLKPYPRNPRRGDVSAIVDSLELNGQYRPVVVNKRTMEVLAGNHTLAAARQLGWPAIAATFVDVDEDQAARIALVDNRANDLAGYDDAVLLELLEALPDLAGTGFDDEFLAELIGDVQQTPGRDTDPGELPEAPSTVVGDLYLLGPHRLLCGDSTSADDVGRLLDGGTVDLIVTDPPYGVAYEGGSRVRDAIANDALSPAATRDLFVAALKVSGLRPGGVFYATVPSGTLLRWFLEAPDLALGDGALRQVLVWVKNNSTFGRSDYHYRHEGILHGSVPGDEPVFDPSEPFAEGHDHVVYGWAPGAAHEFHGGRKQDTVWEVDRPAVSREHPTMKPTALFERMVDNSSRGGDVVYDPFGGSGTTLLAAENLKRHARLMELDPGYCDVIVDRWERHTGLQAVKLDAGV